ncbi:MAG: acyl carrier protein, partial [Mycobacterium sp.]
TQGEMGDAPGPASGIHDALHRAAPPERQQLLESYLGDLAADKLGLAPSSLDVQTPLNRLGADSLITLELRLQLERDLGIIVPVARLLDGPSVASLSGWLNEQLSDTGPAPAVVATPAPQTATDVARSPEIDLLTQVPELSDDAVEELLRKVIAERELVVKEGNNDRQVH